MSGMPEQKTQKPAPTPEITVIVEKEPPNYTPLLITGFLGPLAVGVLLWGLRRLTKTRRPNP